MDEPDVKLEYPGDPEVVDVTPSMAMRSPDKNSPHSNPEPCANCVESGTVCVGGAKKVRRCIPCAESRTHCSFSRVKKRKVEEVVGVSGDNEGTSVLSFYERNGWIIDMLLTSLL
jgi:hypothetical protein